MDRALRTRTRKVAWKASSASWPSCRTLWQTCNTIGPCRRIRVANASSSCSVAKRFKSWPSVGSLLVAAMPRMNRNRGLALPGAMKEVLQRVLVLPSKWSNIVPCKSAKLPDNLLRWGESDPDRGSSMLFGYNTNGFAHHRLDDALRILADLGYRSVALTLDYHALNPYDPEVPSQLAAVRELLSERRLRCVVETGARFLLDPWHKHQPTFLNADVTGRERRLDFLRRAIE